MEGQTCSFQMDRETVTRSLYNHVEFLSVRIGDRHLWKENSLNRAADYIETTLKEYGYDAWCQTYPCYGKRVSNLVAENKAADESVIVIGAHYDTVPGTPGADDNASAVAGLLELAKLSRGGRSKKTLHFVAFVNEEPPCFGSENMGSMVYARYLREQKVNVDVMLSLEMIGFFSEKPIQNYPVPGMRLFYHKRADYIGVVGNFRSSKYVKLLRKGIRRYSDIDARSLTGPEFFGGINLSDNYAFWRHGYRAVMVTDTSFFRNKHYHQETDTIDTLDFERMTEVVKGLSHTLLEL